MSSIAKSFGASPPGYSITGRSSAMGPVNTTVASSTHVTAEPTGQNEQPASVHAAPTAHLDAATLYRILALRTDVFVVEQHCPYPELDGRDLEPGTVHLWAARGRDVLATLRV